MARLLTAPAAWFIGLLPAMGHCAAAAEPQPAAPTAAVTAASAAPEQLEEIVVEGKRLAQMRKAIIDADDRFFARYNEINKNHDFDVHCDMEAATGTRIMQRVCRPAFHERAEAEYGRGLLQGFAAPPPDAVWLDRQDAYRKNLADVTRGDPQLMKMLRERDALAKRYDAELKRRMKGRWVIFE